MGVLALGKPLANPLALMRKNAAGGGGSAGRPKLTLIYSTEQPAYILPDGYKYVRFTLIASGGFASTPTASTRGGAGGGGGGTCRSFKLPIIDKSFSTRLVYENASSTPYQLVYGGMTMSVYRGAGSISNATPGAGGAATITAGYGEAFPGGAGQLGGDAGANRVGFAGGDGGSTAFPELPFGGGGGGGGAGSTTTEPSFRAGGKGGPGAIAGTASVGNTNGAGVDIAIASTRFGSLAGLIIELW